MTIYTQADLTEVKNAVMALAKGERAVTVTISGTRIEYGQADLAQLKNLLSEIQSDIQAGQGGRTILISTSKGL